LLIQATKPESVRQLSPEVGTEEKLRAGSGLRVPEFAPDVRCAEHAESLVFDAPPGTSVLLVSDGFLALATDYRRYDAAGLIDAAHRLGLLALRRELRSVEEATRTASPFRGSRRAMTQRRYWSPSSNRMPSERH
jgi:hypothetical protein